MFQINHTIREAFPFIEQLLQDAFKIDSYLYTYPYENLSKIDRGFRKMVWNEYPTPKPSSNLPKSVSGYRILVVKSTLGFYNIIVYVSSGENPDFIGITPFRSEELSNTFITQFVKSNRFSADFLRMVQQFYSSLPLAQPNDIVSFLQHLLGAFLPEFQHVSPEYINYSEEKHDVIQNVSNLQEYSLSYANSYALSLKQFLRFVSNGNSSDANNSLKRHLTFMDMTEKTPIVKLKKCIQELNIYCLGKLLDASVHPFYVLRLFHTYETLIESATYSDRLLQISYDMSRKYCLLVNNYGFAAYSYLIRNVINYISLHLTEELTLSVIAEEFNKNASFLSGQFSRETGKSLTEWIHEQRIKEALQYFNTTELSVAEVATKVGIHDFGYFSKLFKKQVGQTPNNYRKMMRRSETK